MAELATVVSIKKHPLYQWRSRETDKRQNPTEINGAGKLVRAFSPAETVRRNGEKLEALKWSELKLHRGRHHLYVQIAVAVPAPPVKWLSQLRLIIDDPVKGRRSLPIQLVVPRGPCNINPRTSARFDLYPKADEWLANYKPHRNATITVTTADGHYRLNGNFRHLLSYGR